jgi:hypothetical protein
MFARKWSVCAAVCVLGVYALGLFGCGDSNSSNSTSRVRVLNALINTPATGVDFYLRNSIKMNQNGPLAFQGFYPGAQINVDNELSFYGDITSGTGSDITVFQGNNTNVQIVKQSKDFDPHDTGSTGTYTLAVAGINGQTGDTGPIILRLIDNWPTGTPSTPTAYVRLVNLAPASPAGGLTIYNVSGGVATKVAGLENVEYAGPNANAGVTNYISIPLTGTTQTFSLQVRGSTSGTLIPTASNISAVTLTSGVSYTFFLVGNIIQPVGAQPFDMLILGDYSPNPLTVAPH